jgi:hypothetical protein
MKLLALRDRVEGPSAHASARLRPRAGGKIAQKKWLHYVVPARYLALAIGAPGQKGDLEATSEN